MTVKIFGGRQPSQWVAGRRTKANPAAMMTQTPTVPMPHDADASSQYQRWFYYCPHKHQPRCRHATAMAPTNAQLAKLFPPPSCRRYLACVPVFPDSASRSICFGWRELRGFSAGVCVPGSLTRRSRRPAPHPTIRPVPCQNERSVAPIVAVHIRWSARRSIVRYCPNRARACARPTRPSTTACPTAIAWRRPVRVKAPRWIVAAHIRLNYVRSSKIDTRVERADEQRDDGER